MSVVFVHGTGGACLEILISFCSFLSERLLVCSFLSEILPEVRMTMTDLPLIIRKKSLSANKSYIL
jgi:hypothetical protein